jgi:hypothetical protein
MSDFKVSSVIEYISSTGNDVNSFRLPLPDKMLVFTKDLNEIRKGDGINQYQNLDKLIDFDNLQDIINRHSLLPTINTSSANRMLMAQNGKLVINEYLYPTDLVDQAKVDALVPNYSPVEHEHGAYMTKSELETISRPNLENLKGQDYISHVFLNRLESPDQPSIINEGNLIDNFNEGGYIDSELSPGVYGDVVDTDNACIKIPNTTGNNVLVSDILNASTNINISKIYLKGNQAKYNSDIELYVSRDNGANYSFVDLVYHNGIYSGFSKYDTELIGATPNITGVSLEDHKANSSIFTVTTANTSGKVDSGISNCLGCKIVLTNGITLTITNVNNVGILDDEITFTGTIPLGAYQIEKIIPLALDENTLTVSKLNTYAQSCAFTIDISIVTDPILFHYHIPHIGAFKKDDKYFIYKDGVWKNIVKLDDDSWYYKTINGDWALSDINDPNRALALACSSTNNQMTFDTLEGVSLRELGSYITGIGVFIPSTSSDIIEYGDIINISKNEVVTLPNGTEFRYKLINNSDAEISLTSVRVVNR